MSAISNFSKNLFSKESALNFVGVMGSGLISSRFIPITVKESVALGAVTGTLTSVGRAIVGDEDNDFKKIAMTVATFALVFFGMVSFAPIIKRHFAVVLTSQSIMKFLACNILGHLISFALLKLFFTPPLSLWSASDSQIQKLHAKYIQNTKLFDALSPILQQLIWKRFYILKLDPYQFDPQIPSKAEIAALTDDEIRILNQYEISFDEDDCEDDENDTLLLRYFELDFFPFDSCIDDIPTLPLKMPVTVEEVKNLSDAKLAWYQHFFTEENEKVQEKLPLDVQWVLFEKGCIKSCNINAEYIKVAPAAQVESIMNSTDFNWWISLTLPLQRASIERARELLIPVPYTEHPTNAAEVDQLSEEVIRAYYQNMPDNIPANTLGAEVIAAMNRRFYELKLFLPIKKITQYIQSRLPDPTIDIPLPVNADEVDQLDNSQLRWVYFACRYRWETLSFEVQAALNDRFELTEAKLTKEQYQFNLSRLAFDNIPSKISDNNLKLLYRQFEQDPISWLALSPNNQKTLSACLTQIDKQFEIDKWFESINPHELSPTRIKEYHKFFFEHDQGKILWSKLPSGKKEEFSSIFAAH